MFQKGALSLLADYGGESSDEEVPGAKVSTKRTHRDDENSPKPKRLERLPLPGFLSDLKLHEPGEDSSLHEGRVRSFPHERGNWATYVYIPYERNEGLDRLQCEVTELLSLEVELKKFEEIHLSLTKTVILKHHWIDSFVNSIKHSVSYITKFIIMLDSLNVYCNEEKTRTFIGVEIKTGIDSLLKLVKNLDVCLSEFKLPVFYEKPSFHISIGWCLGDHTENLRKHLPKLNTIFQDTMGQFPQDFSYVHVDHVLCKTGNKLFQIQLS